MEGLLTLLIFGVLFFVMMRYGCGAHIMHGGHGSHRGHAGGGEAQAGGKDPVCGMDVAPDNGYSMAWHGSTYRFCSRSCLEKFEAAPEKFAAAQGGKA